MKRASLAALLLGAACKDEQPGEGTPYPACEGVENGQPCGSDGFCADLGGDDQRRGSGSPLGRGKSSTCSAASAATPPE